MLRGWLGYKQDAKGSTQSLDSFDEAHQIEDALKAAAHIMNDDVGTAEAQLNEGNSPFHKLGKGLVVFLRATLGFEPEVVREASEKLADAESSANEFQKKVQRMPNAYRSPIYPVGTEYAICNASVQLMGAVLCVLNESLTESIRGFYKLRKAYLILDGVIAAQNAYIEKRKAKDLADSTETSSVASASKPGNPLTAHTVGPTIPAASATLSSTEQSTDERDTEKVGDKGEEFVDADETHSDMPTPTTYAGHLEAPLDDSREDSELSKATTPVSGDSDDDPELDSLRGIGRSVTNMTLQEGPDADIFTEHPVDAFIHSASNLCLGLLMLMISLVPPAFVTLLKIVGFRGDRQKGINMLWQASKFPNIFGAMAGLLLFGYYNGLIGFCDIAPLSGEGSYPKERCRILLAEMRRRFPESQLWLLEEARMMAGDKALEKSVEAIANAKKSDLRQVVALQWFERSMMSMHMHDYEQASMCFQKCVEVNNWSHGLYYYIAASAHLELYRKHQVSDPEAAKIQAKKAEELFKIVPKQIGKRLFMARQLPFDVYITRKIQKWEHRAKERSLDFIDAIGVSPLEEMIFFWNGHKRMRPDHLEVTLSNLEWSTTNNPHWEKEDVDEKAVYHILRAAALRHLDKTIEAKEILQKEIISHSWNDFKGGMKDSWTSPCARYEMAANLWAERDQVKDSEEKLKECSKYLEEVAKWEHYDLDARFGLKITTGRATLKRLGIGPSA